MCIHYKIQQNVSHVHAIFLETVKVAVKLAEIHKQWIFKASPVNYSFIGVCILNAMMGKLLHTSLTLTPGICLQN